MFSKLKFLLGLKRAPYKQLIGSLFMVDAETDEIYACALGQGALNADMITEEEILQEARSERSAARTPVNATVIENGKKVYKKAFGVHKANSKTNSEIDKLFESEDDETDFPGWVINQNDSLGRPVAEIGLEARDKFKDLFVE